MNIHGSLNKLPRVLNLESKITTLKSFSEPTISALIINQKEHKTA